MVQRGAGVVLGEVYVVGQLELDICDRIEGHPDFYRRTEIEMIDGSHAETYLLQDPRDFRVIVSGSWRSRVGR